MATFFTGLNDRYNAPGSGDSPGKGPLSKVIIGSVIEVCLGPDYSSKTNPYQSPRDIGKIRYRNIETDIQKTDDQCTNLAYPVDKALTKYPLPGEQVVIYVANAEVVDENSRKPVDVTHMYGPVVSTLHNITYNSYPYLGSNTNKVDSTQAVSTPQADQRFDNNIKNLESYKEGDNIRFQKQLQPLEGDVIIQGRFGNSIRLGSTTPVGTSPWSQAGTGGSGIMILRVDRSTTTTESEASTLESVEEDDSSIYMCTSQKVEMRLSCAKELKSWRARYGIPSTNGSGGTSVSTIERDKDLVKAWQKI